MNVPIPTPTPEQIAASLALENSRRQYRLQDRATILFMHRPDVVLTARDGEPTLADPAPTLAPHITNQIQNDFKGAFAPGGTAASTTLQPKATADGAASGATDGTAQPAEAAAPAAPAAPLQFQEVPAANAVGAGSSAAVTSVTNAAPATSAPAGNSMGVEIITPGANAGTAPAASQPAPANPPMSTVAFTP